MKNKILFSILLFSIFSCKDDRLCFTPPRPCVIRLVDKNNGTDLLNPSNINAFNWNDIKMSTFSNNGSVISLYTSIQKINNNDSFCIASDISWEAVGGKTFYLKLSPTDIDTIFLQVEQINEKPCIYFRQNSFVYNGLNYPTSEMYQIEK
jgi:hypothetical protein